MAMSLPNPQPAMTCCHPATERPHLSPVNGKYEAGPCSGHGAAFWVTVTAPLGGAAMNETTRAGLAGGIPGHGQG
jgi:hypothetical protein